MIDDDSRETATGDVWPTLKVLVPMSPAVQITACITLGVVVLGVVAIVCGTRCEAYFDKDRGAMIMPHDDPARAEVKPGPLPTLPTPTPTPRPVVAKKVTPLKTCPEGSAAPSGATPSR